MQIVKATKAARRIRLALSGPPGSGKTYTALRIAQQLGGLIGVVDTEAGSASDYADVAPQGGVPFDFVTIDLSKERERYTVDNYMAAMQAMKEAGVEVLILDSMSHAWAGAGGILEQVDRAGSSKAGGKFAAWADATPKQNRFMEAILAYPGHVIGTMRTKIEWVLEQNGGRTSPRKVGLAPVQRDGVEYEFNVVGELGIDHLLTVTKSRMGTFLPVGSMWQDPGVEFGRALSEWLTSRVPSVAELLTQAGLDLTPSDLDAFLRDQDAREMAHRNPGEQLALVTSLTQGRGAERLQAWRSERATHEADPQGETAVVEVGPEESAPAARSKRARR